MLLLNIVTAGLLTGAVYALMALGLSVIFGVIRIVNFAHGEMMVLGMFAAYALNRWLGLDPIVAMPLVAAAMFGAGYALQRILINRFVTRPEHMQFLLMLAIAIMLVSLMLIGFGPDARNVSLATGAVAGAALLWVFFRFTRTGKAIRACADNYLGAQVVGLDVKRLYAVTFGLGAACVGAAGSLMLLLIDVHPYLATDYTLLAFIIVIVGGLGSLGGALLGGLLVGVSEALSGFFVDPSMKSMFSYALLILVLLLRPQGLLGKRPG